MARAVKRKKLSFSALIAAVLTAVVAVVAGGAVLIFLYRPHRPAPTPGYSTAELAETVADLTLATLSRPPLEGAGKVIGVEKRRHSRGVFNQIVWKGRDDTALILAEKSLESAWSEFQPGLKVAMSYPGGSPAGRIRMVAGYAGEALVEVTLEGTAPPMSGGAARPPKTTGAPAIKKGSGRIAIIIDDVGNDMQALETLLGMGTTFTYSVLPHARFTDQACRRLELAGVEVMLHLPMEPESYPENDPGPGALLLGMARDQVWAVMDEDLARVPLARGINNHMGSAFTTDPDSMEAVLEYVRRRGIFFVDSRTTTETMAYSLAQRMGVRSAERRVFLDHKEDVDSITSMLVKLAARADDEGRAVGIGHPYPETLEVLQTVIPHLKAMGYEFVPVSEVVR